MILQALYEYYQRKTRELPKPGFENKEIPFVIVLDRDGNFIDLEDRRDHEGKKKHSRPVWVPKSKIRSGSKAYEKPNMLWDHYGFVLGAPKKEKPDQEPTDKAILDATKQHHSFMRSVCELADCLPSDEGVQALKKFLDKAEFNSVFSHPLWSECEKIKGCNLSFRLNDQSELICQSKQVIDYVESMELQENEGVAGHCLVTGKVAPIAKLHFPISHVGQKPAPLAAINSPAYESFGKEKGFNFPVSNEANFAYTTALNHLLRKDSPQRLQVGDASTIFWAERRTDMETGVIDIFGEPPKDDPGRNTEKVAALYKSIHHGRYVGDDADDRFYVLGLAPNAARIAVRFWHVTTVGELAQCIVQHFEDIRIITNTPSDSNFLPLPELLRATARKGKTKSDTDSNIQPRLAGETLRAILEGLPYPRTLLAAAVQRCRAEREITYPRAALIKGCINRSTRYSNPDLKEELKVSLDPDNRNPGYRLGRLFALLEYVQQKALGKDINATIRDRFYGAASTTPKAVFSTLIKLSMNHLGKLDNPTWYERKMGEIIDGIGDCPAHLSLEDQCRFAIGYYHQRQDFFKKRDTESETTTQGDEQ